MATFETDLEADEDAAGERLDVFIARRLDGVSRARAQKLIDDGCVLVDGRRERASFRLAVRTPRQHVRVSIPESRAPSAEPEAIPLEILYEDADLIAVNKPAGMTVHPAPGHPSSTLVNAILAHARDLSGIGGVLRPGIVHRLDRDTSGVILIAKHDGAHRSLTEQLRARTVEKTYMALVEGTPTPAEGVIEAPLARDPRDRKRIAVVEGGREAVTAYRVVERFRGCSLVEAHPRTGRTHQIRVHLAAIGHPIIGDRVYAKPSTVVGRQFLHARRIAFTHPATGERLVVEAALPSDLEAALVAVRAQ